ncbi:hypothetical protein [Pseudomonas mosselii]|uniref:hypothetical protein n=1 Tax=Pseudomonas mosselii TaxID=78327 RepID=UPI001E5C0FD3|nr:hypothetical protein [Pseudomonas mosselii]WJR28892.1 hypothetical protein LU678_002175 [Pseudomonas mosselii]
MTTPAPSACPLCSRASFLCSDLGSPIKTSTEVRNAFHDFGITVRSWASDHGVHRNSVSEVIGGRKASVRGDAHAIAVLLRLKNGDITEFLDSRTALPHSAVARKQ